MQRSQALRWGSTTGSSASGGGLVYWRAPLLAVSSSPSQCSSSPAQSNPHPSYVRGKCTIHSRWRQHAAAAVAAEPAHAARAGPAADRQATGGDLPGGLASTAEAQSPGFTRQYSAHAAGRRWSRTRLPGARKGAGMDTPLHEAAGPHDPNTHAYQRVHEQREPHIHVVQQQLGDNPTADMGDVEQRRRSHGEASSSGRLNGTGGGGGGSERAPWRGHAPRSKPHSDQRRHSGQQQPAPGDAAAGAVRGKQQQQHSQRQRANGSRSTVNSEEARVEGGASVAYPVGEDQEQRQRHSQQPRRKQQPGARPRSAGTGPGPRPGSGLPGSPPGSSVPAGGRVAGAAAAAAVPAPEPPVSPRRRAGPGPGPRAPSPGSGMLAGVAAAAAALEVATAAAAAALSAVTPGAEGAAGRERPVAGPAAASAQQSDLSAAPTTSTPAPLQPTPGPAPAPAQLTAVPRPAPVTLSPRPSPAPEAPVSPWLRPGTRQLPRQRHLRVVHDEVHGPLPEVSHMGCWPCLTTPVHAVCT